MTYITVINNCSADNNMMKAIGLFQKKIYNPPLLRITIENFTGEGIEKIFYFFHCNPYNTTFVNGAHCS